MKKLWKNYHLPSLEPGKSLCGKRNVIIVPFAEWDAKTELIKCKSCARINITN
mgnify:CR=1 FL=1